MCTRLLSVKIMNIVSFGGGTNSTAMIIGMYHKGIPIDLILFADTGAERLETYQYIDIFNDWLVAHKLPQITVVKHVDKDGNILTLEQDCLQSGNLPSIAYGFKTCSNKHKIRPQDNFCNNYDPCKKIWAKGEKITKYIGYDAGEERRKTNAFAYDIQDKKYQRIYPLIEWEWYREDCIQVIEQEGLPLPGKSSCFFCPSMKKPEIIELKRIHPDLFARAVAIEENAKDNLVTVHGLGRNYSWKNFIEAEELQIGMCLMYDQDSDIPCGCYDG